jgi:DNA-binding CsgD family transcriptional regulator
MIGHAELVLLVDALEEGVLLVTARAVIVHRNRVAEALLRAGDLLRDAMGAVGCHMPGDTGRLRRAIGDAAAGAACAGGQLLAVHRPAGGHPLTVRVVAVRGGGGVPAPGQPAAALLVSDPDRLAPAPAGHLRELYGLTPAEARVAAAVLDLEPLDDIAGRLAVSVNCIRIHLQHVFEKTDTHRQAELVRLLMAHRLPSPVATAAALPARARSASAR